MKKVIYPKVSDLFREVGVPALSLKNAIQRIEEASNFNYNSPALDQACTELENTPPDTPLYKRYAFKQKGKIRTIDEPIPPLKIIQKVVAKALSFYIRTNPQTLRQSKDVLYGIPGKGRGPIDNARRHTASHPKWVLKLDIKDFFYTPLLLNSSINPVVGVIPVNLVTCFIGDKTCRCFPVGAPTSSLLASLYGIGLDFIVQSILAAHYPNDDEKPIYTRYVDDLTISGNTYVKGLQKSLFRNIIKYTCYTPNPKKSQLLWTHNDRTEITGALINPQHSLTSMHSKKRYQILEGATDDLAKWGALSRGTFGKLSHLAQINYTQYKKLLAQLGLSKVRVRLETNTGVQIREVDLKAPKGIEQELPGWWYEE